MAFPGLNYDLRMVGCSGLLHGEIQPPRGVPGDDGSAGTVAMIGRDAVPKSAVEQQNIAGLTRRVDLAGIRGVAVDPVLAGRVCRATGGCPARRGFRPFPR